MFCHNYWCFRHLTSVSMQQSVCPPTLDQQYLWMSWIMVVLIGVLIFWPFIFTVLIHFFPFQARRFFPEMTPPRRFTTLYYPMNSQRTLEKTFHHAINVLSSKSSKLNASSGSKKEKVTSHFEFVIHTYAEKILLKGTLRILWIIKECQLHKKAFI